MRSITPRKDVLVQRSGMVVKLPSDIQLHEHRNDFRIAWNGILLHTVENTSDRFELEMSIRLDITEDSFEGGVAGMGFGVGRCSR